MKISIKLFWEFVRFNIVGIINTLLTFLIFSGVFYLTDSEIFSLVIDYLFGLTFSYFMNGYFTFKADMAQHKKQLPRMVLSYALLLVVNYFMLMGLTDYAGLNTYLAQLVTVGVIAVSSFILQKVFVFKNHGDS